MKARTLVSILILVLAVLIIIDGCTRTPKTQETKEDVKLETKEDVKLEAFFQSIKSGDYAEVKRLIEEGADVNSRT